MRWDRLGVSGRGLDVSVKGSIVKADGELGLVGGIPVGITGRAIGGGVILELKRKAKMLFLVQYCQPKNRSETKNPKPGYSPPPLTLELCESGHNREVFESENILKRWELASALVLVRQRPVRK